MPIREELLQMKEQQLNSEIRVGSTHIASHLREQNRELYNEVSIESDVHVLNQILRSGDLQLESRERARLEMRKGRNISTLLLLQEKTFGDSNKMKAVKRAVSAVEVDLNKSLNRPMTELDVEDLLVKYDNAAEACYDYIMNRDPGYETGKKRYKQVRLNLERLKEESEALQIAKELLQRNVIDGNVQSPRDLLIQGKVYRAMDGNGVPGEYAPVRKAVSKQTLDTLGKEEKSIFDVLSGKTTASAMVQKFKKSIDPKDKEFAEKLSIFFADFRTYMTDFRAGKLEAKTFIFNKKVMCISQNTIGKRQLICEYLSDISGLPVTELSNFSTPQIISMVKIIRQGHCFRR